MKKNYVKKTTCIFLLPALLIWFTQCNPDPGQDGQDAGAQAFQAAMENLSFSTKDTPVYMSAGMDSRNYGTLAQPSPYIDVLSSVTSGSCTQDLIKINLRPAGQTIYYGKINIRVFHEAVSGWTLNVGDSKSVNGYGGDSGDQVNDSELQIVNGSFAVYASDLGGSAALYSQSAFAGVNKYSFLEISNEKVVYTNQAGQKGILNDANIFALNGQADSASGGINYEIYVGVNRTVAGNSRSGTKAEVVVWLEDGYYASSGARYLADDDPNLDAGWDWTKASRYDMWYSPNDGAGTKITPYLPFYTQGHPLNTVEKDMYPEDGWMLAYRDFGTQAVGLAYPFFALYNKYRGIFRVMFYNAPNDSHNTYRVELLFKSYARALLTYTNKTKAFLNDFDSTQTEHTMTIAAQYSGWITADFFLIGYDPGITANSILKVNIWGIDQSKLSFESTEFTLDQVMKQTSPGGSTGISLKDVKEAVNQGQKVYKTLSDTKKAFKDFVSKPGNSGKWWSSTASTIANSNILSAVPYVGGVIGLVSSFFGGKDKANQSEPLNLQGSLKCSGEIVSDPYPLFFREFYLLPGTDSPDAYRPLQNIPWGIYNLNAKPVVTRRNVYTYYAATATAETISEYRVTQNSDYTLNPNLNITLTSVQVALTYSNQKPSSFYPLDWMITGYYYGTPSYPIRYKCGFSDIALDAANARVPDAIAYRFSFKINSPVRYMDDEFVIFKVVPCTLRIESASVTFETTGCYN